MKRDPIVDEVRRVRDEHARRFGYDLEAIVADLKKLEHANKDLLVRRAAKPSRTARHKPAA